jgi:hypothetical protein
MRYPRLGETDNKIHQYIYETPGVSMAELARDLEYFRGEYGLMYGHPSDGLILWAEMSREAIYDLASCLTIGGIRGIEAWVAFPDLYECDDFKPEDVYIQTSLKPRNEQPAWVPILLTRARYRPTHWTRDIKLDPTKLTVVDKLPECDLPLRKQDSELFRRDQGLQSEVDFWTDGDSRKVRRRKAKRLEQNKVDDWAIRSARSFNADGTPQEPDSEVFHEILEVPVPDGIPWRKPQE